MWLNPAVSEFKPHAVLYRNEPGRGNVTTASNHGGGRTLNGATGELIDYDVTGYVAEYNAQWERAAKGLRALFRSARTHRSSSSTSSSGWSPSSSSDSSDSDDGDYSAEDYQRDVAEDRAYWGGSADDYNRIKNGVCTWSDSSNYGC